MNKRGLIALSGLLWSIAGFNILRKGIPALVADHRWWVVLATLIVMSGFTAMFKKVSGRYADRIVNLEGKYFPFYRFMSLKGYLLIGFMMSLGIGLARIPGMPRVFFAFFYTGLGTGLSIGAVRFWIKAFRYRDQSL